MFVEMMLAIFALIIAGTHLRLRPVNMARPSPRTRAPSLPAGVAKFLGALGTSGRVLESSYGSVMMIVLAITIMQLVIRFMRVATSELLSDVSPVFRNRPRRHLHRQPARDHPRPDGLVAVSLGPLRRGEPAYGLPGAMLVTAWLMSEGKPRLDLLPDDLHVHHDHRGPALYLLQSTVQGFFRGGERRGAHGKHPDGSGRFFLVIAALILAVEGIKAFNRYRALKSQPAQAPA